MPLPPQCEYEDCIREAVKDGYCSRHQIMQRVVDKRKSDALLEAGATVPVAVVAPPAAISNGAARTKPAIDWKVWTLGNQRGSAPSIGVHRSGQLLVNPAADELLGVPVAVQLLYSANPRMIGLRAVPKTTTGAIPIRRKEGARGFQFSCVVFLSAHGIDYAETRRWKAELIDGVIAITLDAPAISSGRKATAA